ncbi:MAG: DUF6276 family protein [Haloferacaceae archaeon]
MPCATCDAPTVAFRVPDAVAAHAPDGPAAAVCTTCLRLAPADPDEADPEPTFDRLLADFPAGEGGAALALAVGLLDTLALNRAAVVDCCEFAEAAGVDVLLTLDRLDRAGRVEPHYDLSRRSRQLADFL